MAASGEPSPRVSQENGRLMMNAGGEAHSLSPTRFRHEHEKGKRETKTHPPHYWVAVIGRGGREGDGGGSRHPQRHADRPVMGH